MSGLGCIFAVVTAALVIVLPKRWAPLPMLLVAAYVPFGQQIAIGPFHFTGIRILVAAGILRLLLKGERVAGGLNTLDKLVLLWAAWLVCSSLFHQDGTLVTRLGEAFTDAGAYFLFRVFLQGPEDMRNLFKIVCLLFVPLAAEMIAERLAGKNYFALLGGTSEDVLFRQGHFRARGPFEHPILAGTVGAVCLPMALYLWRQDRKLALVGLVSTGGVIFSSSSSGPIMTVFSILVAMALWRIRGHLRAIRWLALLLILALDAVMKDPVYFLMARIDISGGSTGWYRAALIRSAIQHAGEWWLVGTDVTRGWMHVSISDTQSDIPNQYIGMGVSGGLLLLLLFLGILAAGFTRVGWALRSSQQTPKEQQFMIWTLGAILFGHATTFLSVAYFDQSVVFFYLVLAGISSVGVPAPAQAPVADWDIPGSFTKYGSDFGNNR